MLVAVWNPPRSAISDSSGKYLAHHVLFFLLFLPILALLLLEYHGVILDYWQYSDLLGRSSCSERALLVLPANRHFACCAAAAFSIPLHTFSWNHG